MFESWLGAPFRGKVYNVLYLICQFLVWCACCVAFAAELFEGKNIDQGGIPTYHFYYDRIESEVGHANFADMNPLNARNNCTTGGRTLVAFTALTFILITVTLILTVSRIASLPFNSLPHPRQSLLIELICGIITMITYFLGMVIYAGLCYRAFQDNSHWEGVRATGYAYIIAAFFLQLIYFSLAILIRRDEECWMGIGGDGGYGSGRDEGTYAERLSGFSAGMSDSSDAATGQYSTYQSGPTNVYQQPVAARKSQSGTGSAITTSSSSKAQTAPIIYQSYQNSDT